MSSADLALALHGPDDARAVHFAFSGLSRALHNQRALYLKRLLPFDPHVILVSVPYQLMR